MGLLNAYGLPPLTSRMIPARAGFTPGTPCRPGPRRDHPRSRGVYCGGSCGRSATAGSSPLARGLHSGLQRRCGSLGIIPARAGFTVCVSVAVAFCRDHPRSRGVYWQQPAHSPLRRGSSPLARGLRGPSRHPSRRGGIIPARAGFTVPGRWSMMGNRDHPRSRGVYSRDPGRIVV